MTKNHTDMHTLPAFIAQVDILYEQTIFTCSDMSVQYYTSNRFTCTIIIIIIIYNNCFLQRVKLDQRIKYEIKIKLCYGNAYK